MRDRRWPFHRARALRAARICRACESWAGLSHVLCGFVVPFERISFDFASRRLECRTRAGRRNGALRDPREVHSLPTSERRTLFAFCSEFPELGERLIVMKKSRFGAVGRSTLALSNALPAAATLCASNRVAIGISPDPYSSARWANLRFQVAERRKPVMVSM